MAMASRGIGFGLSSFVQGACRTCKVSFQFYGLEGLSDVFLQREPLFC